MEPKIGQVNNSGEGNVEKVSKLGLFIRTIFRLRADAHNGGKVLDKACRYLWRDFQITGQNIEVEAIAAVYRSIQLTVNKIVNRVPDYEIIPPSMNICT